MIQKSFDRTIVGLVPEKETALLAVSGGIDSICLASLFLNSAAGRRFAVAHCNFHLRGEDSDSDEALVAAWCGRNGVCYHKADFDTEQYASSHNVSIEMAARELRYDWFASLCRDNGYYGKSRQERRIQTLKNRENKMPYTVPLIDSFRIGPVIMILQRVGSHIFHNLLTAERQHWPQQAHT